MLPVVPLPAHVTSLPGDYAVPKAVVISAASPDERNVADFAAAFLRHRGISAVIVPSSTGANLRLSTQSRDEGLGNEGYRLRVDAGGMSITANRGAGLFYGLQTLEQLFPSASSDNHVPDLEVSDVPAFPWRGMMLDVSRHFFPVQTVEKFIDLEAHYKLNVFHWHLSDDQGWRVEIKRYPRLTSIGSCRSGSQIAHSALYVDHTPYCGYYTQAQIREVVAYAAKRYVTIVPEIDMPGHSTAAIAAYPFLACSGKAVPVSTTWGGSYPICPTDRAIAFEENVLSELLDLFPGPYIHTGGDEVPFDQWEASPFVTSLMKRQHLTTYAQVQAYFERRIEQFIESKGRRMVGWDEVLDGGISSKAVIMSWRGVKGGILAAQHGNDAVMSPDGPLYFNSYQGDRSLEPDAYPEFFTLQDVYRYNPLPATLTPSQKAHILGVQGNLWAEYMKTSSQLFYQALPRELALSEIGWVPPEDKDWDSFIARTGPQYLWLENGGFNFRIPNPSFTVDGGSLRFANVSSGVQTVMAETTAGSVTVSITDPVPNGVVYYTTSGTTPDAHAHRYADALHLDLAPGQHVEVTAIVVLPDGRKSTPTQLVLRRGSDR
jgi:hexosaminidase